MPQIGRTILNLESCYHLGRTLFKPGSCCNLKQRFSKQKTATILSNFPSWNSTTNWDQTLQTKVHSLFGGPFGSITPAKIPELGRFLGRKENSRTLEETLAPTVFRQEISGGFCINLLNCGIHYGHGRNFPLLYNERLRFPLQ